jgi:hypothetical protein
LVLEGKQLIWLAHIAEKLRLVCDPAIVAAWCRIALNTAAYLKTKKFVKKVGLLHFTAAGYLAQKLPPSGVSEVFSRYLLRTAPEGLDIVRTYLASLDREAVIVFQSHIPEPEKEVYSEVFDITDEKPIPPLVPPSSVFHAPPFAEPMTSDDVSEAYEIAAFTEDGTAMRRLFGQISSNNWAFHATPYRFSSRFEQEVISRLPAQLPEDAILTEGRGPWRHSAVRTLAGDGHRLLALLAGRPKGQISDLIGLASLTGVTSLPQEGLVDYVVGLLQPDTDYRTLKVSLRILAVFLNSDECVIGPSLFRDVSAAIQRILPLCPLFETSLVLLAFEPVCGSDAMFLSLAADALALASTSSTESANLAAIIRRNAAAFARLQRRQRVDFDALLLVLLESALPSDVLHGITLLETSSSQNRNGLVIGALLSWVSSPAIVKAAVRFLLNQKRGEEYERLLPLFALESASAEFVSVLQLMPFALHIAGPTGDVGTAILKTVTDMVVRPPSLKELKIALTCLELRAGAARQLGMPATDRTDAFRAWAAGIHAADRYDLAQMAETILSAVAEESGIMRCLELVCTDLLSLSPRFFPAFVVLAKYAEKTGDEAGTKDALAKLYAGSRPRCHRAAILALRHKMVKKALDLALWAEDCPESDAQIEEFGIALTGRSRAGALRVSRPASDSAVIPIEV